MKHINKIILILLLPYFNSVSAEVVVNNNKKDSTTIEKDAFDKARDFFTGKVVKIRAYSIVRYAYDTKDQGRDSRHDFSVRNVNISISGEVNKCVRYNLLLDMEDPQLQEFYIEFTPNKYLNLRLGQFKNPLSLEIHYSPGHIEYVNTSRPSQYLMGYGRDVLGMRKNAYTRNSFGRDVGIQAHGLVFEHQSKPMLDYALAVFQGSGVNSKDPDNTKDFVSALTIYPLDGLRIRGGAYFGGATYDNGKGTGEIKHVRNRYTASTEYSKHKWKLRYEYMRGKDGLILRHGMYGMVLYDIISKKINTLVRISYYNNDIKSSKRIEVMDYSAGFTYNFAPLSRILFNYTYTKYSKEWDVTKDYTYNHQVAMHFQVGF